MPHRKRKDEKKRKKKRQRNRRGVHKHHYTKVVIVNKLAPPQQAQQKQPYYSRAQFMNDKAKQFEIDKQRGYFDKQQENRGTLNARDVEARAPQQAPQQGVALANVRLANVERFVNAQGLDIENVATQFNALSNDTVNARAQMDEGIAQVNTNMGAMGIMFKETMAKQKEEHDLALSGMEGRFVTGFSNNDLALSENRDRLNMISSEQARLGDDLGAHRQQQDTRDEATRRDMGELNRKSTAIIASAQGFATRTGALATHMRKALDIQNTTIDRIGAQQTQDNATMGQLRTDVDGVVQESSARRARAATRGAARSPPGFKILDTSQGAQQGAQEAQSQHASQLSQPRGRKTRARGRGLQAQPQSQRSSPAKLYARIRGRGGTENLTQPLNQPVVFG